MTLQIKSADDWQIVGRLSLDSKPLFIIINPRGAGVFSRDFTTNLARRALRRALNFEKLKAPPFPLPEGARDTNDWCIRRRF